LLVPDNNFNRAAKIFNSQKDDDEGRERLESTRNDLSYLTIPL
jgi:hypothetical protein